MVDVSGAVGADGVVVVVGAGGVMYTQRTTSHSLTSCRGFDASVKTNACVCVFSLEGRFEDEELQQILDDIQTKRSFQY